MMKRLFFFLVAVLTGVSVRGADTPVERIYVSTDRNVYIAGDAVWCSLFSLDKTGRFSNISATAYLELISTDGTASEAKIGLLEGRGAGQFRIPVTTPTGTYRLIAYTAVNADEQGSPWLSGSRLLTVFNTTSVARVTGGVDILEAAEYEARTRDGMAATGKVEISMRTHLKRNSPVSLTLRNVGKDASVSVSVHHRDGLLPVPQENTPERFLRSIPSSVTLWPDADGVPEYDGEVVSARIRGTMIEGPEDQSVASLSSTGSPSDLYIGQSNGDDRIRFYTTNIYGDRELVCEVSQLDRKEGYIDFESPFLRPALENLPHTLLSKAQQSDLSIRKAALRNEKTLSADTLTAFIRHREDLLLESVPCKRYHLDDYNRFPSIRETFIEFIPELRLRKEKDGRWMVYMIQSDAANVRHMRTGHVLVMMDGVLLSDLQPLVDFDAMLVEDIDIYQKSFVAGNFVSNGVVNIITKNNYVTALPFPSNVRVVDFKGVSYPVAYGGDVPEGEGQDLRQLLYWHPVVDLAGGTEKRIDFHTPGYPGTFDVVVEGFTRDGTPVSQVISFEVE